MSLTEGWTGRCFEDFVIGDIYRFPLGRTISEADNSWFTLLTMNTNQVHFNAQYAAASEYGRLLVNSGFTVALVLGMSVTDVSQNAVANLGWSQIELPHPVFVGDTLYTDSQVLAARLSKSRPEAGIVTVRTRGINQDGVVCVKFVRTVMVHTREAARRRAPFPEPIEALDDGETQP